MEGLGVFCMAVVGLQLARFIHRFFNLALSPKLGLGSVKLNSMGKWAVVTGATDGLGKAYAEALAKKGMAVVLISRTQEKLDKVAKDISDKYNVETKTIAVDFTRGQEIYHVIEKQLQGLEIGVLINNVGMSYPNPEYFLTPADATLYADIISCNIHSVINMCKLVMPDMAERKKGVVINVSSLSAQIPSPLLTIYGASKAFVDKFSIDLGAEYAEHGIIVQSILPGYVASKMSKIRKSSWMAPSPTTYVNEALKTVGVQDRTNGYLMHTVLLSVVQSFDYISPSISKWIVMRVMGKIRRRALKRQHEK